MYMDSCGLYKAYSLNMTILMLKNTLSETPRTVRIWTIELELVFKKICCFNFQVVFLAATTNERMNFSRYTHFHTSKPGVYKSPFQWVDFPGVFAFNLIRKATVSHSPTQRTISCGLVSCCSNISRDWMKRLKLLQGNHCACYSTECLTGIYDHVIKIAEFTLPLNFFLLSCHCTPYSSLEIPYSS